MTPDVVVDVGNSRIKWGRCVYGRDITDTVSMPVGDAAGWVQEVDRFRLTSPVSWAVASVNPPCLDRFVEWANSRGDRVLVFGDYRQVPMRLNVDVPSAVGIDRLLSAFAACKRLPAGVPGIVINVGTALTVDLIDAGGGFQGGAIAPGGQLMFRALHDYTAKLPLLNESDLGQPYPGINDRPPGKNTVDAIAAGVVSAVRGAAEVLVREMSRGLSVTPRVFVTGGGRDLVQGAVFPTGCEVSRIETLTLDGIRLAAEALP